MNDTPRVVFPKKPIFTGELLLLRVQALERLVLELTKHIDTRQPVSPGMVAEIEVLKLRHADV